MATLANHSETSSLIFDHVEARPRPSALWSYVGRSGRLLAASAVLLGAAGCSGGGGDSDSPSAPPPLEAGEAAEAARFLSMATFGPREDEIQALMQTNYAQWFTAQRNAPVTLSRPILEARAAAGLNVYFHHRIFTWRAAAIHGPDQLRQRTAFALSQILVCSDSTSTVDAIAMAEYQDILARNALGNYRQLLEEVTLSGAMGVYLSMAKNRKADPAANIRADENFAREIMQLFSIGLDRLHMDGTKVLDGGGNPIQTYDQEDVEELARVFTGWSYANSGSFEWAPLHPDPMQPYPAHHDATAATIIGGNSIPVGLSQRARFELALDIVSNHPNVPPFLARRLIQRFTTSNPSPAYVQRVAQVFANNGQGQRGDLYATVRAILLDPEVWGETAAHYGKLREPILREVALVRAFGGYTLRDEGPLDLEFESWLWFDYGQAHLGAPTVFNFYSPDYIPQGDLNEAGLFAPEFQITTTHTITDIINTFHFWCFNRHAYAPFIADRDTLLDFTPWQNLAADPPQLVDRLSLLLAADQLSPESKQSIAAYVATIPTSVGWSPEPFGLARVREAAFLIAASPEAAILR